MILDLSKTMSRKRCKIGANIVIITNRKSICTKKSVSLNELERHNGPYFALFHRTRVQCRRKTIIMPTSVSKATFDSL